MDGMPRINALPSLALMRSFEAAARHESYTMAAEELGVTQGAVSRQVRELEAAIGVTLFRRVGRAVRLSKADVRCAQSWLVIWSG